MACTFSPAYTWAGWELTATHSVWTLIHLSPEHKPTAINNRLCKLHYTMELVISEQRTNYTVLGLRFFEYVKQADCASHCRCVGSPTWNFSGQWDTDTVCTRPGTIIMQWKKHFFISWTCNLYSKDAVDAFKVSLSLTSSFAATRPQSTMAVPVVSKHPWQVLQ